MTPSGFAALGGRAFGLALAGAAFIAPAFALLSYRAMAAIFVLVLAAALWDAALQRRIPSIDRLLLGLVLAFLAWGAASLSWSIDPGHGLAVLPGITVLILGALVVVAAAGRLTEEERRLVGTALLWGIAIGAALQIVEAGSGAAIKRLLSDRELPMLAIKGGSTILAVLVWPAVGVALERGRPWLAAGLALAIMLPLPMLDGRAALLAVIVGGLALLACRFSTRATAAAIAGGSIVAIVAAPLLYLQLPAVELDSEGALLPFSARHRIEIWRFAVAHVVERPFFGWGFDVARVFPGGDRIIDHASGARQLPLHPHSAPLQWWLELGLVGAVLGALAVAAIVRVAHRMPARIGRSIALSALAASLVMSMVSHSAWRSWWLAGLGLAAAFVATLRGSAPHAHVKACAREAERGRR